MNGNLGNKSKTKEENQSQWPPFKPLMGRSASFLNISSISGNFNSELFIGTYELQLAPMGLTFYQVNHSFCGRSISYMNGKV